MKNSTTTSVAVAAIAMAWFAKHWRNACVRERQFDEKCQQDAFETFESEGGLVRA